MNGADIALFVDVLVNGTINFDELCASDVNGDGFVNDADIPGFISCTLDGPCP